MGIRNKIGNIDIRNVRPINAVVTNNILPNIGTYPMLDAESLSTPTIYVDSAATGANNGTSWINAFTTINAALTAAAASGDVIEISGGAVNKTYTENLDVTKAVTIQGSKTSGHLGTVIQSGGFLAHNTSGIIKVINIRRYINGANYYAFNNYANSNAEFYDVTFRPCVTAAYYFLISAGRVKFVNCVINNVLRVNNYSKLIALNAAAEVIFDHVLFDYAGVVYQLPAGTKWSMDYCTVLGSGGDMSVSFLDIGNSATTDIELKNTAFFGIHPVKSGAASKVPIVENCFWHKTPSTVGYTTFDSSNKSNPADCITNVDPLFTTVNNTNIGDLILRIDDRNILGFTETACAVFNPEIKVTHNVDISGFHTNTRPSASEIDRMRRLIAAGNEIGCHGSTHSDLSIMNAITISATGTAPTLDITVTQAGDSSTWTGTLSVTINATQVNYDLLVYSDLLLLVTELNGAVIGDGVVTAAKTSVSISYNMFSCVLDAVVTQDISVAYVAQFDDAAYNRFEITESILDLEKYINSATDRNDNNAVAGTTEPVPNPVYVCEVYATAYTFYRASTLAVFQNNANIKGAWTATSAHNGNLYAEGRNINLYAFAAYQAPNDASMFALICATRSAPEVVTSFYHGIPTYGGTAAALKALLISFGVGDKTFSEYLDYIRTDGGWTITEPNAAFTGNYDDYMSKGDYTLQTASPLKGAGA